MTTEFIREQLRQKGLKVTPQRVAVYEAVVSLKNHPAADQIIEFIRRHHPNVSPGTVYKVLDSLVDNELIKKVKNEQGVMRYDAIMWPHHHLYCTDTDKIEDFIDPELDWLMEEYVSKKKIKGFKVQDITVQISGKYKN